MRWTEKTKPINGSKQNKNNTVDDPLIAFD